MLIDRKILEEKLNKHIKEIQTDKKIIEGIKLELSKHKIIPGEIQRVINSNLKLNELDLSFLYLFTKSIYNLIKIEEINPKEYFTEKEIKVAERYEGETIKDKLSLPITFDNVASLGSEDYIATISIEKIVDLYESNLLEYNFQTQRNPKLRKSKENIIMTPNLNKKSVKEIAEHILNNTYLPDTITFNILADGNDDIVYNAKTKQLTIQNGEIDVLDGFHRINGCLQAYKQNQEIELNLQLAIKNYNLRKAQSYVAQVNTINKIDKTHLQTLKADRYADTIVKELQRESDLRGLIVQTSRITSLNKGLVTYSILADAIHQEFNIKSKKEALDLAEYLTRFFDYLIGSFQDEFKNNIEGVREYSLINNNNIFVGYVVLARRLQENDMSVKEIERIVRGVDFNKDNPTWEELGILENGRVVGKNRKKITSFFEKLNLDNGKGSS